MFPPNVLLVQVVQLYGSTNTATAWKNFRISMGYTEGYCVLFWMNCGSSTSQNSRYIAILQTIEDVQEILAFACEVKTNSLVTFSNGLLRIDTQVVADQQKFNLPIVFSLSNSGCQWERVNEIRTSVPLKEEDWRHIWKLEDDLFYKGING